MMKDQPEGNRGEMFIILVISLIPLIKIPKDGIATDNRKIILLHACLPFTCIYLAHVCRQLFLPALTHKTNNEGQTEFCVFGPNEDQISY